MNLKWRTYHQCLQDNATSPMKKGRPISLRPASLIRVRELEVLMEQMVLLMSEEPFLEEIIHLLKMSAKVLKMKWLQLVVEFL
jgi:hypothetical protein